MGDRNTPRRKNENVIKRKPIKRTRPLCTEELLAEDREFFPESGGGDPTATATTTPPLTPTTTTTTVSIEMGRKSIRDKEKKKCGPSKERWLLTRKTWKYMADAGRRLIPEGVQNRSEDLPKIEEYFQEICRSEPRFVLWRRKCSYPGARTSLRNSKWRGKAAVPKGLRLGPEPPDEQTQNADHIINMLKDYLNLNEEKKTTMLLGTKTVRPDQTESPSAQRPVGFQPSTSWILAPSDSTSAQQRANEISAQVNELLDRLRSYSQSCSRSILSPDMITTDILANRVLLKRIYTELKKQQLHRILGKHSSRSPNLPHSSSLSSLWNFRRDSSESPKRTQTGSRDMCSIGHNISGLPVMPIKKAPSTQQPPEKKFSTFGTQTDFIPLHVLQRMAKDFEIQKKEEERLNRQTDEESEKATQHHSRRKSSIDNEDVSQSVSDTIKRYLRMARKKSVADDHASRFKRVNYDRNLRNIRAKGEINPPGMDEGPNKATQTLDAWPVIALGYIRGSDNTRILEEAHADWLNSLQKRTQQKEEYEEQLRQQQQKEQKEQQAQEKTTSGHSSFPPSTTATTAAGGGAGGGSSGGGGIFHSGTQFLSNLLHGHHHSAHDTSNNFAKTNQTLAQQQQPQFEGDPGAMQKSKSSSNVGQFVSKKIWRSRSKSQTRTSSPSKPEWTPQGNCVWTSASGKRLILSDAKLHDLTEIERKVLHRVAIEKINQLNIGVSVTAPGDGTSTPAKAQKRRPLLIKRKALTTGFFDSGKKNDSKGSEGGGLVFGVSLEKCVDNDNRIHHKNQGSVNLSSRNSISSLLEGSPKIGSCESLPLRTNYLGPEDGVNLLAPSPIPVSRSQSDVRRSSHDDDDVGASTAAAGAPPMVHSSENSAQQVPALVVACIKHLEEYGLHTVGIFRVSTSKKRVRQLKEDFDRGEIISLDPDICPHDVATILKEYLRDLPEPLICRNLYKAFVKTQKIRNRRLQLEALSHLVQLLPVAHRDTLYVLLKFLAKIVRSSDDITSRDGTILLNGNKMDSSNLATVFAPNILRCTVPGQGTSEQEIDDQIDVINVIRTMIDHYEELFKVPADLLDEVYTNMIDTFPQQLDYLCEKRDILENDGIDSAASLTPVSSPPPTALAPVIEFGKLQQVVSEQIDSTPRRIYSREDFMHGNAAKGDPNGNGFTRRRERVSKMKYVESEHEIARRRRRERSLMGETVQNNSPPATSVNTGAISKQLYYPLAPPQQLSIGTNGTSSAVCQSGDDFHSINQRRSSSSDTSPRRLSSPFDLRNTGVVTASLKIPVQMTSVQQQAGGSQGSQGAHQYSDGRDSSSRSSTQLDLSDIPFIEDSDGQFRQTSITGTLSFGNRKDSVGSNTYQIPISYEGRMLNTPSGSSSTSPESIRPSPFQQQPTKKSDATKRGQRKNSSSTRSTNESGVQQDQQGATGYTPSISHHIEPKITTSISSIGGAVLRSKTADFERMLMQNKKYKTAGDSDDLPRSSSTSIVVDNTSGNTNGGTTVAASSGTDKNRRPSQGPIYKRQELISSAKRSSK